MTVAGRQKSGVLFYTYRRRRIQPFKRQFIASFLGFRRRGSQSTEHGTNGTNLLIAVRQLLFRRLQYRIRISRHDDWMIVSCPSLINRGPPLLEGGRVAEEEEEFTAAGGLPTHEALFTVIPLKHCTAYSTSLL